MQSTYKIAMAASMDAGNRNARKNGRSVWNEDDREAAVEAFHRVFDATL